MVAPDDPLRVMTVNVAGTIYLAEACRLAHIERLIALSSIGVYGDQPGTEPVKEDAPRLGTDVYSCSKIAMESVLLGYRMNFGLPVHLLRMSSIFGPGRRTPCFVRGLLEAAEEGRETLASGDTSHRRQFLHIDDAVEAVKLALAAPSIAEFAYNITGGTWLTEGEVIDVARRAIPTLRARVDDVPPLGLDGRMGPLDTTRAAADLGYRPRVSLKEGIAKYARSRKERGPMGKH
jgi:nucleoside-diphosphate-sugar epimerase